MFVMAHWWGGGEGGGIGQEGHSRHTAHDKRHGARGGGTLRATHACPYVQAVSLRVCTGRMGPRINNRLFY